MTLFLYSHYDFPHMQKAPSGIVPLLAIDRKVATPLHRQIYDGYRSGITGGSLRSGQRVPSTRALATELGVSRIPVLNAYAQLLAEGYFESRVGAGTLVSSLLPDQVARTESHGSRLNAPRLGPRHVSRRCSQLPDASQIIPWLRERVGAFSPGHPALDEFPHAVWSRLVLRHSRNNDASSLHYRDPTGSPELQEAIAAYLRTARGVRCEAQQIMIVSGSQQALDISARVLLDPGSWVWMEEPGYRFARNLFSLHGCKIAPVPVEYEGLNVAAGIKRCRQARAALVTPSHQYPLGVTMSASRRLQLLKWAQSEGAWIIEDDYDSEYRFDSMPIASLQGLDSNPRVIYVGTFSKVLFPALRLGYVVIPPDLVERFIAVRLAMDIAPPQMSQAVLADFIREGHFSRHLRRTWQIYRERRSVLTDCIRKYLDFTVDITGVQAGIHLCLTLPKGCNDREIAVQAAEQKLWLLPLSACYAEKPLRQGFVLGFGSTPSVEMPRAVRKLQSLVRMN
jgi:GntR family transcriptional regulator/MocR family aminotransferase